MDNKKTKNIPLTSAAIIPAAGAGIRMKAGMAKQYLSINDSPILALTLEKFQNCPAIDSIILVVPEKDISYCKDEIVLKFGFDKVEKIVMGGEQRHDSVRLGIEATNGRYDLICIHDGVRPFIKSAFIEKMLKLAYKERAVIAAIPSKDTVKEVGEAGFVKKTYNRDLVWLVQTPQIFRYKDISEAHKLANEQEWNNITDDAFLLEKMGVQVKVITGSENNIKITTPGDLEISKYIQEKLSY